MDFLASRAVVITLAILGALAATAASVLQGRGAIGADRARQINKAGYACMGVSMLLFIIAGFRT